MHYNALSCSLLLCMKAILTVQSALPSNNEVTFTPSTYYAVIQVINYYPNTCSLELVLFNAATASVSCNKKM